MSEFVLSTKLTAEVSGFQAGFDQGGAAAQAFGSKLDQTAAKAQKAGRAIDESIDAADHIQATQRALDALGVSLDRIQARARQLGDSINRSLNVRDGFGGAQRAADIAAYGQALDALRAKYNPMFAAQQKYVAALKEIAQAERVGALSAKEAAAARAGTKAGFADFVRQRAPAAQSGQGGGGLSDFQRQNLMFQANDVFTSLVSGMSPLQVLAQQGPQIAQAMQGASPGQALKALGSSIAGLVSPTTLAVGAVAGLAAAVVVAGMSFSSAQRAIERQVSFGVGRGSGATLDDINRAADQNAGPGLSRSEARGAAGAVAGTGRISGDMIGRLTGLVPGMAALMGGDIEAAGQRLAKAFADPAQGAADLEQALGPLDEKTRQLIRSQQAVGDLAGAQRTLYQAIAQSTKDAAEQTGLWARSVNALSDAWDKLGQATTKAVTGGTLEEQLGDAQMKYVAMTKLLADRRKQESVVNPYGDAVGPTNDDLEKQAEALLAEINRLQAQVDQRRSAAAQARKDATNNLASQQAGDAIRTTLPDIQRLEDLKKTLANIQKAQSDPDILGITNATAAQAQQAIAAVTGALETYMSAEDKARASEQLAIDAINARTTAEKASIASREKLLSLSGQEKDMEEQRREAAAAAALVIAQGNRESEDRLKAANDNAALSGLSPYQRQLAQIQQKYRDLIETGAGTAPTNDRNAYSAEIYAAQQEAIGGPLREANRGLQEQVAALRLQQEAFGKSAGEAAKLAAAQQLINQYNAAGVTITPQLSAAIDDYATKMGEVAQRTDDLTRKQNQVIASLDQVRDTSRNVLGGLFSDLMHGKSAADALADAAGKIGDQLINNAANSITEGIFGPNGKAGGGLFGDALGGFFGKQVGLSTADISANIVNVNGTLTGAVDKMIGGGFNPAAPAANSNVAGGAALRGIGAPDAVTSKALAAIAPGGGSFSTFGNYRNGVDPRLTDILQTAAQRSGFQVEAFSGLRPGDPRFHGKGLATDVNIIDPATGKALPNYQNGAAFRQYETLAQNARAYQMERYPELGDQFRWGGYFSGPKGKYGATDLMHFDLGGGRVGMAGGSWANGLTAQQRAYYPNAVSMGIGQGLPQMQNIKQLQQTVAQLGTAAQTAAPGLSSVLTNMNGLPNPLSLVATNATQASTAIGQGGGGFTGALQSLIGMLASAIFPGIGGHADGGEIYGPGTGRSDSMLTRVSTGETIVTAMATSKYRPLLRAMNANMPLPAYADGGEVRMGGPPAMGTWRGTNGDRSVPADRDRGPQIVIENRVGAQVTTQEERSPTGGRRQRVILDQAVADATGRPNSKTMQAYAAASRVTRR